MKYLFQILFLSALCWMMLAPATSDANPFLRDITSQGNQAYQQEDYARATQEYLKAQDIEPLSAQKLSFKPFEIKSIDKPLISQRKKTIVETIIVRLTVFRTGEFTVPSIPLVIWSLDRHRAEGATPPAAVNVISVGKSKTDKADIRPIKGPASVPLGYLRDWVFGALAAALSGGLIALIVLRRRRLAADPESLLPAHRRAMLELDRLIDNRWPAAGKDKEHYSGLSDILRRYFERRFGLEIMEHTTPEILFILKQNELEAGTIARVKDILENCDLVKFAKFVPPRELASVLEKSLREIVEKTKPAEKAPAAPAGAKS